jgi:hypothetical protein
LLAVILQSGDTMANVTRECRHAGNF